MRDIERDLELMMLGAVLARPDLASQTNAASRDIQTVLEAIRTKDQAEIKRYFSQRGVQYEPGQAFAAVFATVRRRYLKAESIRLSEEIAASNKMNLPNKAATALQRLQVIQAELGEIKSEEDKRTAAKAAAALEARKLEAGRTEAKKAAQTNTSQASTGQAASGQQQHRSKFAGKPDDKPPQTNQPKAGQAPPKREPRSSAAVP